MPTNVPSVTWTPTGFVEPPESQVLTGVQEDINNAFGGNLNFGTTSGSPTNATPQGQLAASMAAIIGEVNDTFLFYATQTDPAFAEGRMQDAIGRIYFIERNGPIPTTLQITATGAVGTTIPVAALVVDAGGNQYGNVAQGQIGLNGTVQLTFVALVAGSLAVPNSVSIYQAIPGWDTATLISGVQGQNAESRAAFETRRGLSTAANSLGSLPSVLGTVLSVPGVLQAFVFENTNSTQQTVGGVTMAANSLYVAAYGGNPQQVAQAIWSRKAPGCAYAAGNTTVTIQDTSPGYSPPFPTYTITYQIPNPLPLLFNVSIVNSVAVPANAVTLVQSAIINAAAGNPNAQSVVDGPAVSIGAKIWASRFVPSIAALGTWAQGNIISIQIGSNNDSDAASAFGYVSGTAMFLTTMLTGTISANQYVSISNGSGVIVPGTNVISQITGTVGGTGVYIVDAMQSIGLGNLLLQSDNFPAAAAWTATNASVTGSAGTSPDGTNDSWTFLRGGTATSDLSQVITKTAAAVSMVGGIYARAGSGQYLALRLLGSAGSWADAVFNLNTGAVSFTQTVGGNWANVSALMTPSTHGFFLCTITATSDTAPTMAFQFSFNSVNGVLDVTDSQSSTGIVFGAAAMVGSTLPPYAPTTTSQAIQMTLGFATPDQTSVQVLFNQIPTVAAGNINVTFQ